MAHQQNLRLTTGTPGAPDDRMAGSAFSPVGESPSSSRISQASQAGGYPFPRQTSVSNMQWAHPSEPNKHNTAPPMARPQYGTPEGEQGPPYGMNGRTIQRPSLPVVASHSASHSTSQLPTTRNRSISSPDVNGYGPGRRTPNGAIQQGGEDVPVPPIPPHMAGMRGPVNRSNTNSPTESLRNARGIAPNHATGMRPSFQQYNSHAYDQTPAQLKNPSAMTGAGRVLSPPMSASALHNPMAHGNGSSNGNELPYVSQLKVKIHYDPDPDNNYVSIVIGSNIGWETLRGRIDHKMQKNTKAQIAEGTARLKYVDAENDMVTIEEDEDVDMAIEVWKEKYRNELFDNKFPELVLYWKELVPKI
jgi:cell division control protein 24